MKEKKPKDLIWSLVILFSKSQCNWDSLQQNENILHLTQMQFINVFHFFAAAHYYGDALMQADRLDIEHVF